MRRDYEQIILGLQNTRVQSSFSVSTETLVINQKYFGSLLSNNIKYFYDMNIFFQIILTCVVVKALRY